MKKIVCLVLLLAGVASALCCRAYAAELPAVMNAYTTEDSLTLFIKEQGMQPDRVYIGNNECTDYSFEAGGAVRTIVIVDNSLSIRADYREGIKTFLADLVAARNDGDIFTIATFAEEITYLVKESNDYLDIMTKIDGLSFVNQEAFFSKTLYTIIDDIKNYDEIRYTRIIVIADGADDEEIGYTDDELSDLIQAVKIPVYSIGCTANDNAENLKRMFSFSRLSNAQSYIADDVGWADIMKDILQGVNIQKVVIRPSDEMCDGTSRSVRINFGDNYCTAELVMPFKAAESEDAVEPSVTVPPTASPVISDSEEEPEEVAAEGTKIPTKVMVVGGLVLIFAVAAVTVIVLLKRNKKAAPPQKEPVDLTRIGHSKNTVMVPLEESGGQPSEDDTLKTMILGAQRSVRLRLQDIQDPSKTFEYPIKGKLLIGRDPTRCQIVIDYSKYISSVHCEVLARGKDHIVRDGGDSVIRSTNGTFVNDKRVAPEALLPPGAVLRLGELSFKVSYI